MSLYRRYARIALKGQLSRRFNSLLLIGSQLFLSLGSLAAILVLFSRFSTLAGYSRAEVLLCFGMAHAAFSLAETIARGFDIFPQVLAQGEFDRILVRPRGTILQLLGSRLEFTRLGRFVAGSLCLAWALREIWPAICSSGRAMAALRLATLASMLSGSFAIFTAIFMLGAALAFLTTDSLELVNILSDGGKEMSQYPLSIYERWFRRFFTFVVPFGCVNYLPLEFVLGRPGSSPWAMLLPLAGFAFLAASVLVWRSGVRRYVSTGS